MAEKKSLRWAAIAAGLVILAATVYAAAGSAAGRATSEAIAKGASLPLLRTHLATPRAAAPTQPPQQPQQPGQIQVQVNLVNVFATVRDKRHGVVDDLKKEDFKILEDGNEQQVAFFQRESDLPITLALLIDTSGSMDRVLPAEQDAASRFIKEIMRKKDEALVISFDLDVNLLADFTEDTAVLERAIRRTQMNAPPAGIGGTAGTIGMQGGGTDLYDAVYLACHDELATEAGRKAVILLTDAEDTGSKLGMKDAIEAAQRTDAVIHILLIRDFMATSGIGVSVSHQMAGDTGGRVIDVHNEKTLEKAFDEIGEELRSQYVLGYYPTNNKKDGTFRKITVMVDRPDMKILARKGYYAPYK